MSEENKVVEPQNQTEQKAVEPVVEKPKRNGSNSRKLDNIIKSKTRG